MTPRERAIAALELRQPDMVPHFELEMQLTQEYFGRTFASPAEWDEAGKSVAARRSLLERDAALFCRIADEFDYCIIFYSWTHRPTREDYVEGIRVLRELDAGRRLIMAHGDTTLGIPDGDHYMQFSIDLFERADELKEEQVRRNEEALAGSRELREAGLDGFILCSDYCFNSGPFMSPAMFSEFVTPYLSRLVKGYRELGAWVIKHTDGNIMPILDQLVSCKPHGLHSIDPMAGMDIAEVKRLAGGKVCLVGNVNCALMQTGTTGDILESCRYAMESGKPGGGYIFSTSNVVFKGMPRASYDLMMDYYRKNRGYSKEQA
jgi:uroporphyrinogen decarboxylase